MRHLRGRKVSKGHVSVRRKRKEITPGSIVLYKGQRMAVHGTHGEDEHTNIEFAEPAHDGRKSANISKVKVLQVRYRGAWKQIAG